MRSILLSRKFCVASAALADQALLSAISLVVSLAFIWHASKDEYGLYLLLLAPALLVQGVQNALLLSPQATVVPASSGQRAEQIATTSAALQLVFAMTAGLVAIVVLLAYQLLTDTLPGEGVAFAFGVGLFGVLIRDAARATHYAYGNPGRALVGDLIFSAVVLAGLAILIQYRLVSSAAVFAVTGTGALVVLLRTRMSLSARWPPSSAIAREFWSYGRWALPGMLAAWINLNAYAYIVAIVLGAEALADINAARLFMTPVALLATAWSNVARPKFSALFSEHAGYQLRRLSMLSAAVGVAGTAVFTLAVYWAYPWLERLLSAPYRGLWPLVLMWALYYVLNISRTVLMATLMTTERGYRQIHNLSWAVLAVVIPGLWIGAQNGSAWVIGVLCLAELLLVVPILRHAMKYWA